MSDTKTPSTLLPNNDKESATSVHFRKVIVIALSVVIFIALTSATIYQYRLRFNEFSKLKSQIEKALMAKDEPELLRLAAHEFTVGQPELGNGAIVTPQKVMSKVIQLALKTTWSERTEDFENLRILYPEKGNLQLTFNNTPSGWTWSGVQSISPEEIIFLVSDEPGVNSLEEKVQYHDIHSDEAKGDEPTMDAHP